ncbi:MAG TPA: pitrilysin family protein [Vicinamibacterales bacterium]|nr:pitrilysin family protein [Vicinamibacterales bacterium]
MTDRFELPGVGPPALIRFPRIEQATLENGLAVWSIGQPAVPVVSVMLVLDTGTASDPPDRPGLTGLVADLLDEGAGSRNTIELSDALARIGSHLEVDTAPDATTIGLTTLAKFLPRAMGLLADIITRPHLADADLVRVRELRVNRLRQMRRLPGAAGDRALLAAVFGSHPYGHGAFGTTRSLEAITVDEARAFWSSAFGPQRTTLVVAGDLTATDALAAARSSFGHWSGGQVRVPTPAPSVAPIDSRVILVNRPGSPQSDLRVGHPGPPRRTPAYHPLITVNAILGGQFTSRINRKLREAMGVTYGARTSFDFRAAGGSFVCDASVDAAATAPAVLEVLAECQAIREDAAVGADELARAKASLTRGYVKHFETAGQLARAVIQIASFELDEDEYDRFVPRIEAVSESDIVTTARAFLHPDESAIVVVGDAERCQPALESLGKPITDFEPEF